MRLLPVLLLRLALLVAISASAALVVDYANAGDPSFCGVTSGCFAVRRSGYAYLFGVVQLPYVGLVGFSSLFGLAFVARNRLTYGVVAAISAMSALFAAYLLWLQHSVIGAMCPWCVAVDSSAIVAAGASAWAWHNAKDEASVALPAAPRVAWAWILAAACGLVAPFVWGRFHADAPLPETLKQLQTPGKLTIISFTDFECPFCRRLHPELHKVETANPGRVHLERKMMPLSGHLGAEPAALVYLCTPEPLREVVADKLYTASTDKLTPTGAILLAATAGANAAELTLCVNAPDTRAKLEADKKLFESLGGPGLPFTYVGRRVVSGANVPGLESAVERELTGEHLALPVWAMFVLIGAAFVSAIIVTLGAQSTPSAKT